MGEKMYIYIPHKASVYAEMSCSLIQFFLVSSSFVDCFLHRHSLEGFLQSSQTKPKYPIVPHASCLWKLTFKELISIDSVKLNDIMRAWLLMQFVVWHDSVVFVHFLFECVCCCFFWHLTELVSVIDDIKKWNICLQVRELRPVLQCDNTIR